MATTHLDVDGDPHLIEVPHDSPDRVLSLVLLHELSHIRNPKAVCLPPDRWWREEGTRLALAGALWRERVF